MTTSQYRPENVKIEYKVEGHFGTKLQYLVRDFDGTPIRGFKTQSEAEAARRTRAGVIRAALARRSNKKSS